MSFQHIKMSLSQQSDDVYCIIIKFAALAGALDEKQAVLETLIGFKRAGATMIISYYAKEFAQWLNNKES